MGAGHQHAQAKARTTSRSGASITQPITASNPSLPRVDTITVQVQDQVYAGSLKQLAPGYVLGTPTSGANIATQAAAASYAGALPASSYVLAYVLVPAAATSITTGDILNVATPLAGAGWVPITPASGITNINAVASVENNVLSLAGNLQNTSGSTLASGTVVFTMPPGMRPQPGQNTYVAGGIQLGGPNTPMGWYFEPNGNVEVLTNSTNGWLNNNQVSLSGIIVPLAF